VPTNILAGSNHHGVPNYYHPTQVISSHGCFHANKESAARAALFFWLFYRSAPTETIPALSSVAAGTNDLEFFYA
jgi:hypothetical protein